MRQWPELRVMESSPETAEAIGVERIRRIFADMILLRTFDERSINLQRQGRIGTFPPSIGQEACEIASAHALAPQDWVVPSYRDHGAMFVHGIPFENVVLFAMGRMPRFTAQARVLPTSIPIASHLPHAVGLALGSRFQGETDTVAMAYFGDGGTSEGDFHEALNFAGVFRAPVIFFCQNNGWAISVPVHRQTASPTLVQKADAYGVAGIRVDGNDALAVFEAVRTARRRAVAGEGATLIEAVTYRLGPHTTSDDPTRYRPAQEWEAWRARDPVDRLERFLMERGWMTAEEAAALREQARERVQRAVEAAEAEPPADPGAMFAHVFEQMPPTLAQQAALLQEEAAPWPS